MLSSPELAQELAGGFLSEMLAQVAGEITPRGEAGLFLDFCWVQVAPVYWRLLRRVCSSQQGAEHGELTSVCPPWGFSRGKKSTVKHSPKPRGAK